MQYSFLDYTDRILLLLLLLLLLSLDHHKGRSTITYYTTTTYSDGWPVLQSPIPCEAELGNSLKLNKATRTVGGAPAAFEEEKRTLGIYYSSLFLLSALLFSSLNYVFCFNK